jgi:hypothetical protein
MSLSVSNSEAFALYIEHAVRTRKVSYMEAVVEFCEKRDLEPETIVPFLSDKIKHAIAAEAQRLHLLHKSAELPFEEA